MQSFNNNTLKIHQATINSISKGVQKCDTQLGEKHGSQQWNKTEEELIALYQEIGRNIVLDNFLPF